MTATAEGSDTAEDVASRMVDEIEAWMAEFSSQRLCDSGKVMDAFLDLRKLAKYIGDLDGEPTSSN